LGFTQVVYSLIEVNLPE